MNKKKYIIILVIVFILGGITNNLFVNKNKESIDIYKRDTKGTFKNVLSMMLETDLDSGEYERSTGTQWPTDGYIFNKELSKCENGGELDWDSVNNQVLMIGASSDKCYVYFDKYASVTINNLSLTSTPTSITATISAAAGSSSISKYMFSINNGAYIESESNVHTFVGLNSSTEYTVNVKVIDANGRSSAVSSETIETSAYVNATINSLTEVTTYNSIKVTVNATQGNGTISKYYYSKDGGSSYIESTSNSYTFTDLASNTQYSIKAYIKDSNNKTSAVYSKSIKTDVAYYHDTCTGNSLACYVAKKFTGTQGSNGIYLHNSSLTNGAGDNSYRYAGANPNNYVCFGSTAGICPTDNLYRIIGVFGDQVKLIKSTLATSTMLGTNGAYHTDTSYYWNFSTYTNTWSESNLNTVNLNTNYTSYLGTTWTNKITTTTWKVGGNTYANLSLSTVPNAYQNEIVSPAAPTTYRDEIGLMYVSDYGYAAEPSAWTTMLDDYNTSSVTRVNWMKIGYYEWTISRRSDVSNYVFYVLMSGSVYYYNLDLRLYDVYGVRPVFYLNTSVNRTGGTGTSSDPYRVA